jgi:hypothetical protein
LASNGNVGVENAVCNSKFVVNWSSGSTVSSVVSGGDDNYVPSSPVSSLNDLEEGVEDRWAVVMLEGPPKSGKTTELMRRYSKSDLYPKLLV